MATKQLVAISELHTDVLYTILSIKHEKDDYIIAELDDVKIKFPREMYTAPFVYYTKNNLEFLKPTYYHCFCEQICDFCNCEKEELKDYCPCVVFGKVRVCNMDNYSTKIELWFGILDGNDTDTDTDDEDSNFSWIDSVIL